MNFIKENVTIDENCCWNWNKSTNSSGYGQFYKNFIKIKNIGQPIDMSTLKHMVKFLIIL